MKICTIPNCNKPASASYAIELIRHQGDDDDCVGKESLLTYDRIFVCTAHDDRVGITTMRRPTLLIRLRGKDGEV